MSSMFVATCQDAGPPKITRFQPSVSVITPLASSIYREVLNRQDEVSECLNMYFNHYERPLIRCLDTFVSVVEKS